MEKFNQPEKFINSNSAERLQEIENLTKNTANEMNDYDEKFSGFFWNFDDESLAEMEERKDQNPELYKDKYENFQILKDKLHDQTVVDLGSNLYFLGVSESLKNLGIKKYIAVDKFADINRPKIKQIKERVMPRMEKEFGLEFKNEDMLSFISRLPDNSVNYVMNGIDDTIIQNEKYWQVLAQELHRTTVKNGIVTGFHSEISFYTGDGFKVIKNDRKGRGLYILEKV